jgi:hypothetical protein
MNKNFIISTLIFSILFFNFKITFAADNNRSLRIPLNFEVNEFSDNKDTLNNVSTIDIELPSSTWNLKDMEFNFTNIKYHKRVIKTIEDTPNNDNLFLDKHTIEGLAVQIKLNHTTTISGAYINIRTLANHTLDEVNVQIRGYNSSINAPNSSVYGSGSLNMTIVDGWNYQNFGSAIRLPKGNYSLVMEGSVHAGGEYHWYYNDFNPNNPDLYISRNEGSGWINGISGSPFLYKLDLGIRAVEIYPEEFDMTAEINGSSYKILNGTHKGTGFLRLPNIDFSPNDDILHIPITSHKFFFNLSYHLKMRNLFRSNAFVRIAEEDDNFWEIIPEITRYNYNYSIGVNLPNNWYNLSVFKDSIDITSSKDILINGNFLYILNDTITDDASWEITANSPKIGFIIDDTRGTQFERGKELIFSAIAPIIEGNFTFILYNEHGAEMDKKIIPVTSSDTIYSFNIPKNASLGNWTAYVYWNSYNDASVKSQPFTIIPISISPPSSPPGSDINLILVITIGGILAAGVSVSLTAYQITKRKKKRSESELKRLSNKFKDILSLNYLIVSDNKAGTNVYEQTFMGKLMDPSLISGFLDAIRNFGIELTGSYLKSETMSLDYEDSIILMNESQNFRLIIIMSEKPSEEFTNSITNLAEDIKEKYGDLIQKFRGGQVTQFAGISELVETHLNVSFASPLKIAFSKKVKLNVTEKSVIKKANEIMKQTNLKYFYTSFLMPDQQFDPEMTEVIFNLINKKIFQPIDLNLSK